MTNPSRAQTAALRFIVAPLLVYVLAMSILEVGGLNLAATTVTVNPAETIGHSLTPALLTNSHAHIVWLSSVLMFCTVALMVLAVSIIYMRSALSEGGLATFMLVGAGLSAIGVTHFLISTTQDSQLALIFRFTFESLQATGQFHDTELTSIFALVTVVNILVAIVPFFVMLASCSLVLLPEDLHSADPRYFLSHRMADLKTVTNLGSSTLVAGALHMLIWLRWPIVFSNDSALQAAIGEWALSVTLYCGTAYSLIIVALYIPCSIALTKNADILLQHSMPELSTSERADWLEQHGYSPAPIRQLPQIIAGLAPIFAGPIGSAVSNLGSPLG